MELGIGASVRVKQITDEHNAECRVNEWLENNPDIEIIDIKITSSSGSGLFKVDVLIIYRREI